MSKIARVTARARYSRGKYRRKSEVFKRALKTYVNGAEVTCCGRVQTVPGRPFQVRTVTNGGKARATDCRL